MAGLTEGQELLFPVGVAADRTGRVAIPDFRLGEVVVVGPGGEWRGPWTTKGEGPGEVSAPVAAVWDESGVLAVFDIEQSKVIHLTDGRRASEDLRIDPSFTAATVASGQLGWAGVLPGGAVLLVSPIEPPASVGEAIDGTTAILLLRPDARVPDTLARVPVHALGSGRYREVPAPGWPRPLAAVGAGGTVAVGDSAGAYRIRLLDPDGRPVRDICRDAPPVPLTERERGRGAIPEERRSLAEAIGSAPEPKVPAAYGRLMVGSAGRLWVQRDRPDPFDRAAELFGEPGARYDVFAADGPYLGTVKAPPRARLQAASGDTVWAFVSGDLDDVSVVAYRIDFEKTS
ncbi:MAG: hypothetical protein ACE5HP_13090 [Gemmatimonadota bacterium]